MKNRIISMFLSILMCLSVFPVNAFAEDAPATAAVTKNVGSFLTEVELDGVEVDEDGNYYVKVNEKNKIKLKFKEKQNLEMDMTDTVYFELPKGINVSDEKGTINIGVVDGYYKSIYHSYTITDNVVTITWNKDSEYFEDLSRAHYVEFTFNVSASFDGSTDEVIFGADNSTIVKVDNTGYVTVNKDITGLKSEVNMTEEQKKAMKFELRDGSGKTIKTFTYFDMEEGSITFEGMEPGDYSVVETGHPNFDNHTFDEQDSVKSASGTLENGGVLNLSLANDYEFDKGSLVIYKSIDCINWDGSKKFPDSAKDDISFTITGPDGYKKTISYADFSNGKKTLNNLEVGEYTITEHNEVAGYNWTYKVNNAEKDSPSANVQITKDGVASASFENSYVQKTAKLTIRKTASGASVPANATFTVTFPDGTTRSFKYSDMNNGSYTFNNVPIGTYRVEEDYDSAKVVNYALAVDGEGEVEILNENEDKATTISNSYTPVGTLVVDKTIAGINSSTLTDAQKKDIVFKIYDSQNRTVGSLTYADILAGRNVFSNLPVGRYKIKETASVIPGYSMVTVPSSKEVYADVEIGKTTTGYFKNTYTRTDYRLSVFKTFGDGSYYTQSNLPNNIKSATKFTVKKNGETVASCTYANLEKTLADLALTEGGTYTITEVNPTVDGIKITTQVSVDGGKTFASGTSGKVTVEDGKRGTVVFKNTYTPQGVIKGDKTVVGLPSYDETELKNRITFSIFNEDGTLFRDNITLAQLKVGIVVPAGNYYVQETGSLGVAGYNGPAVKTQVDKGTVKNQAYSEIFSVDLAEARTVYFTNTYEVNEDNGKIKGVKYVKGLDGIGSGSLLLNDRLNVNNTDGKKLYEGIKFKIEERIDGKWYEFGTFSLDKLVKEGIVLRAGHYKITETGASVSGYRLDVEYILNPSGEGHKIYGTQAEFDITDNHQLNIEIHNIYTKLGNLKITKRVSGNLISEYNTHLGESSRKQIVFEVTGPFGFSETFTFNDICNDTYGYGEKVFKNIPVGEYTVKETAGDIQNYTVEVSSNIPSGKTTVVAGDTVYVNFTNTYTRKLGNLTIRKTLAGDVPDSLTEAQKKAMVFSVRNADGEEKYSVTYDQFVDGSYTFSNIPTGKYKVVESIGKALTNSYDITVGNNRKEVTVPHNDTVSVSITNTFSETGSLKLVKDFAGANIPDSKKATVQFKYWKINDSGEKIGNEKTINYSDFTDGYYIVKNLEPGRYCVAEMEDTTGYIRTTTVNVNGGETVSASSANTDISFGNTSTVTFTNTYKEVSSLKITKSIIGDIAVSDMTEAQKKAIKFTVEDSSGKQICEPFTYFDMTDGTKIITDLVPGEYIVKETISDPYEMLFGEYTCATKYKVGANNEANGTVAEVVAVHGENTVKFTNDYREIAPLSVVKSSSMTYVGMVEKDGAKYPVWRFTLAIDNINPLTTRGGTTTFSEVFDSTRANLFRLATAEEVAGALKMENASEAKNAYISSLVAGKEAPNAVFNEKNNTIVITGITDETADKCNFVYYLIIKDREALRDINTPDSADASGVSISFNNKVTYHPMPNKTDTATTEADYVYSFNAVNKGITNLDENGNLYDIIDGEKVIVNYANYYVTLNESGVTIGDSPTIVAVDRFSENQMVLISSIKTEPEEGVSYKLNNSEKTLEFTIPNGTPVKVSYRINVVNDLSSAVHLTNSIDLLGFVGGINQEVFSSLGGDGQGEVYSINLNKVDAINNSIKMEGVQFSLYDGENDALLFTDTTDAKGQIRLKYWGENGSFMIDHEYYLVEESTLDGYNLDSDKIWFKISKDEDPGVDENGVNVLRNGGELIVSNEPVSASFAVTKNFNNWGKQDSFTFKLEAVGNAPMPAAGGDVVVTTQDDPNTAKNESTGTFGLIRYVVSDDAFANGGVVTYNYTIQEIVDPDDMVEGITYDTERHPVRVVISDRDGDKRKEVSVIYDENKTSLTVTNKYAEGSLTVSKTLAGNDVDTDKVFIFDIKLDSTLTGTYSGVAFTNGEATVRLKGGESKTIEGLPEGIDYTVTERDYSKDGYENSDPNGFAGTIDEDVPAVAEFTNTRNTYGGLTVRKSVAGNAGDKNKDFSFTVELDDETISGTYGDMTFENGVASFTLKDGESMTAERLPNGTGYTVTEADYSNDGYVTTRSGEVGTIIGDDETEALFTNTKDTYGDLIVRKSVAGNAGDKNKDFSFTVELSDKTISGTYGDMTFTDGAASFTLKDGESMTATGLPNGTGYTVTEADYSNDGYVTTKSGEVGTVIGNDEAEALFTNTRNTYGDLTVRKSVAGNAADKNKDFSFTVELDDETISGTYGDMTFVNGVASFTLKDGESMTATGLPNGINYEVTEADYSEDGYITTKSGEVGTIVGDDEAEASFTNTRDAEGSLTVSKTLAGNDVDTDKVFTFNIKLDSELNGTYSGVVFTDGEATVTLKGGESRTIEGLPNGIGYTVTEEDYSEDGYENSAPNGFTGKIDENVPAVAAFTNTRNTYGDLTVKKSVAGNAPSTTKDFSFTVELSDKTISGTYGDMTFVNGVASFTLKDSESKTATGLPNGINYTVTEADYTEDGYVTTRSGEVGIIAGDEELTAEFINTRNAEGSLTVSKTLAGNDTDSSKEFTFVIVLDSKLTGTYSDVVFTDGEATVVLKGGESKTIEGLPNGTGYTVIEEDYSEDGYENSAPNGFTGKIDENVPAVAAFTNTRNTYGDLIVRKELAGNAPHKEREFGFTVELSDKTISGTYGEMTFTDGVATFTLKGGESKTATGLPNGISYKVIETDYSNDGYMTTTSGEVGTIIGDDEVEVLFTNTRDAEGSLTISKKLAGNDVDFDKEFVFTIKLDSKLTGVYSDVVFTDGEATVVLKGGESKTIEGLPNGTGYTVTEADYSEEGYENSNPNGFTGKIDENVPAVAAFTNTRNTYGDLTVTKKVAGNAGNKNREFKFTVELDDKTISGTYGKMKFKNGVATFTLKHGQSITAKNLPNGIGYKVTEEDYSYYGYVTTRTGGEGVIIGDVERKVAFTNTRSFTPPPPKPPDPNVPNTGDNSNLLLWIMLFFTSVGTLFGTSVYKRRKRSE